jgi:hypothetical protein
LPRLQNPKPECLRTQRGQTATAACSIGQDRGQEPANLAAQFRVLLMPFMPGTGRIKGFHETTENEK